MRPQLDPDVEKHIDEKLVQGRKEWLTGNHDRAEKRFLEGWALMPEPKTIWGRSWMFAYGMCKFYTATHQFNKARNWGAIMYECQQKKPDASTEVQLGIIEYEAGIKDEACKHFQIAYDLFKSRPFQGLDPKYLKSLKESKNKKG